MTKGGGADYLVPIARSLTTVSHILSAAARASPPMSHDRVARNPGPVMVAYTNPARTLQTHLCPWIVSYHFRSRSCHCKLASASLRSLAMFRSAPSLHKLIYGVCRTRIRRSSRKKTRCLHERVVKSLCERLLTVTNCYEPKKIYVPAVSVLTVPHYAPWLIANTVRNVTSALATNSGAVPRRTMVSQCHPTRIRSRHYPRCSFRPSWSILEPASNNAVEARCSSSCSTSLSVRPASSSILRCSASRSDCTRHSSS